MEYRTKTQDSDASDIEEEERFTLSSDETHEKEEGEPLEKRTAAKLWGDSLLEESLQQRSSRIALEKQKELRVPRGPETYHVPADFVRIEKEEFEAQNDREVVADLIDDPFGDGPVDLSGEIAFCERPEENFVPHTRHDNRQSSRRGGHHESRKFRGRGSAGPRGHFRGDHRDGFRGKGRDFGNGLKRSWTGKVMDPIQLLSASYSLETLMATEFPSDISIEQLGDDIAKAMESGIRKLSRELFRHVVSKNLLHNGAKSRVKALQAIALFEETRNVESHGGMMTDNGQRRRTPGGVFISLFKLDSDISEDVKKEIFGQSRIEARKMLRARRKGRSDFTQDVARVAELMKKEREKEKDAGLKQLPQVNEVLLSNTLPPDGEASVDFGDVNMEP